MIDRDLFQRCFAYMDYDAFIRRPKTYQKMFLSFPWNASLIKNMETLVSADMDDNSHLV